MTVFTFEVGFIMATPLDDGDGGDRASGSGDDPDDAGFWSLWLRYEDELYRCCLRWMEDVMDAEDALSAAMLKAKVKLREQGAVRNERAWLRQLAKNLCMDLHRQRGRRAVGCENLEEVAPDWRQEGLVDWLLQEEFLAFCGEAIASLPPKLREVMVLWVEEDCSYGEIGERLGLSGANVRKRVSQARVILRRRLAEYERGVERRDMG
ncbi:RNA polymerase sigma factor [Spirulina sp. CCNP1310]|uniref:RNA polymerase sigma factor n=1 Tax=Spirulina sp. CCNP1310 TaxID=3110249 RepID=UPI002B1F9E54|nr:RNA polymerase sigma factor [Spirulina sp. CCNP1310]MEA5420472.1 RNA polymerase sigma factor [Spirulina sp. CCNP1310]